MAGSPRPELCFYPGGTGQHLNQSTLVPDTWLGSSAAKASMGLSVHYIPEREISYNLYLLRFFREQCFKAASTAILQNTCFSLHRNYRWKMTLNRERISSYFKKWINPFSSIPQGLAKPERPKSRYSYRQQASSSLSLCKVRGWRLFTKDNTPLGKSLKSMLCWFWVLSGMVQLYTQLIITTQKCLQPRPEQSSNVCSALVCAGTATRLVLSRISYICQGIGPQTWSRVLGKVNPLSPPISFA